MISFLIIGILFFRSFSLFFLSFSFSFNFSWHFSYSLIVIGGAYGTAKSAIGISSMGVMKPELVMKAVIPVIFAGIIGIYGLIVCVILLNHSMNALNIILFSSFWFQQ